MFVHIASFALLVQAAAGMDCAGFDFFGQDRNPDMTGNNDVLPLDATPMSDAARDAFFTAIDSPATEDLETLMTGDTSPSLVFPFTTITATLTGGEIRKDPPINGQYAISPITYFSTDEDFTISFTEPIAAFGFFGVDIGDVQGILTFTAVQEDGTNCTVQIPHEVDGPSGGVLYFGFVDISFPFTSVVFTNSEGMRDRFAFDDFTIALREAVDISDAPSAAPSFAGELCEEGITNADETVCCDASCGVCGGCNCDMNPGGPTQCCPGVIAATDIFCMQPADVACLLGEYVPVDMTECVL